MLFSNAANPENRQRVSKIFRNLAPPFPEKEIASKATCPRQNWQQSGPFHLNGHFVFTAELCQCHHRPASDFRVRVLARPIVTRLSPGSTNSDCARVASGSGTV
jgi:hypothetical protein